MGEIRSGTKSDILSCIEDGNVYQEPPQVTAIILDGPAIVNMLNPGKCKTFVEYSEKVFQPYVMSQLEKVERIDVVWDRYLKGSLKNMTRKKRGRGVRRRVTANGIIPKWPEFLRVDDNKTELFLFLAEHMKDMEVPEGKVIQVTSLEAVITLPDRPNVPHMLDCKHEEADTRMFVHVANAIDEGHTSVMIRTVDSDVVVIAVSVASKTGIDIWIAFGTGNSFRYISAHGIANSLGDDMARALPFFHAFTGCDVVSSFHFKGKKTAFSAWKAYPEVTQVFLSLSQNPGDVSDEALSILERFVILLYDRSSNEERVNEARKVLFTQKGREIEMIPPTQAALIQHTKRTIYQAGHVWNQCMVINPELPQPSDWGYEMSLYGEWKPFWTELPEAAKVCYELKKCGCKTGCQRRCTCKGLNLKCTALCLCNGQCLWSME